MRGVVQTVGPDGFGAYSCQFENGWLTLEKTHEEASSWLIPGFIDQHIHGGYGIDFMSAASSDVSRWADHLGEIGYETFFPTTITFGPSDIKKALSNLPDHPLIGGFHLEGPFISPKHPGAQPPSNILQSPTGPSDWDPIFDDPRFRVITIAPEEPGNLDIIRRLSSRGVKVGIGHTDAVFEQCQKGVEAGASHTTHTFNAMRGFHHREAGTAGFAMLSDQLHCELIYDRIHVCREAAALLLKCQGPNKVIAVSDGTMAVGMKEGTEMKMWGLDVVVGDRQVRLRSGALAGSAITLLDAFQNLSEDFGLETAIRLTSLNARHYLGMTKPPRRWILMSSQAEIKEIFDVSPAS